MPISFQKYRSEHFYILIHLRTLKICYQRMHVHCIQQTKQYISRGLFCCVLLPNVISYLALPKKKPWELIWSLNGPMAE